MLTPPEVWDGHTDHIRGVAFSDDGKFVISISGDFARNADDPDKKADYSVRLWDPRTGKQIHKVEGFREALDGISLSPGGRFAIFGYGGHWEGSKWIDSKDHRVRLLDVETKTEIPFGAAAGWFGAEG